VVHNWAQHLLQEAHKYTRLKFNARREREDCGATTATALLLREKNKLHACNVGDCLWVVLRKSGSEMCWKPEKWCEAAYTRTREGRFAPKQLSENRNAHDGDFSAKVLDLQAADVVLVASDGLWDNLDGKFVEGKPLDLGQQIALFWTLPDPANEQAFEEALRAQVTTLLQQVVANMHTKPTREHSGKPDDLTLIAAYATHKTHAHIAAHPVVASGHAPSPTITPPPSPSTFSRAAMDTDEVSLVPATTGRSDSTGQPAREQPVIHDSVAAHVTVATSSAMDTDSDSDCYIVDPP
jgi:serine/threonine protein phosphatase PrpC